MYKDLEKKKRKLIKAAKQRHAAKKEVEKRQRDKAMRMPRTHIAAKQQEKQATQSKGAIAEQGRDPRVYA